MTHKHRSNPFRAGLLAATAMLALPAVAQAQDATPRPAGSEEDPAIVPTTGVNPNGVAPNGLLDSGITGVGQMRTITNLTTRVGFVCSGTLINPRTVITAAHCVNGQAANTYGFNTGGTPISFGFQADNLVARRLWAGFSATGQLLPADANIYQTNVGNAIYSGEHVWYDPRSLLPANAGFINSDLALVTLDTPANDIPTWAMLFTPLTSPTHGVINGYGATGTSGTSGANLGVDSRRRIAENMIDFLGSLDDRNNWLFCPGSTSCPFSALPQSLYQLDFDSPAGQAAYNPAGGAFDFDLFDGAALPNEGTSAGGDSGGPLIVDTRFDRQVIVAALSGGSRFFGPQPFSSFGGSSFYQPLFLYWDLIVANNPYKYVSNLSGDADWTNASHWIQTMDPNYVVERDGQLVNALPGSLGLETGTNTTKFGTVCFLDDCLDITQTGPEDAGTGAGLVVPGGPGSINFVPNNVRANPQLGIAPRYYDVTLSAIGTTTASTNVEIDRLTIDGPTKLNVASTGNLRVLGDFTQFSGWTNVDGLLKTGEAFVGAGILSGSGTIDPTYLTVLAGAVVPGGNGTYGTLTVKGDVVLSSASLLAIDLNRTSQDKLVVMGDGQNAGAISVGGALYLLKPHGAAPRDNQSYQIITATGGVSGSFNAVSGKQGVLDPFVIYNPDNVVLTFRAGKLALNVNANPTALAFAGALDQLRGTSYNSLYSLYGAIDVMEAGQLTQTLSGLAPRVTGLARIEAEQQKSMVLDMVSSRLSLLGTSQASSGTLQVMGAPETLNSAFGQTRMTGSAASQLSFARSLQSTDRTYANLPENVSGFISGGYSYGRPGGTDVSADAQRSTWHIAMGVEMEATDNFTFGTAFGYVKGRSNLIGSGAQTETSQVVGYGSYRLGKSAYVAGLASLTNTKIGVQRGVTAGFDTYRLNGDTHALSIDMQVEAGANLDLVEGLNLNPHAGLRYSSTRLDGYRETGGELALQVDSLNERRLDARFGIAASGSTKLGSSGWSMAPELAVDHVQTLAGNNGNLTVRFANAAGVPIVLSGFNQDRSWTEVKGGLRFAKDSVSFGATVESSIGRDDYRDNRAVADFKVRF